MRLFFIRHGQSLNNALWMHNGTEIDRVADPDITDIWKAAVAGGRQIPGFLSDFGYQYGHDPSCGTETGNVILFCSLMARSIQSASIISDRLGLPVYANLDIHECGGMYLDDLETGVADRTERSDTNRNRCNISRMSFYRRV